MKILDKSELDRLFDRVREGGRTLIGPTIKDGAIVLDAIERASELPIGWTDSQGPGRYRLERRDDQRAFGYVVGPDSAKEVFFPAREVLYRAERRADGKVGFTKVEPAPEPKALLGLRACDLAAIDVQDRVFTGGDHVEPRYAARREDAIVIAIHCTEPGELCFCTSTGTGPRVTSGADLAIAERGGELLVEAQSERGRAILDSLPGREAQASDGAWLDDAMKIASTKMGREVDLAGLPGLLFGRLDHPRWKDVASRCLSCGNCTSVCPTCFCSTAEDPSDLDGASASRERLWESCFSAEHGAMFGHTVRPTIEDRYRQWLTHKVGAWVSQLGSSGCVGCGRCIAWCPVGIDLTQEIAALRQDAIAVEMPAARAPSECDTQDLVPRPAELVAITRESGDVFTLSVRATDVQGFLPGQFNQLSLPGIGEAPISIAGSDGIGIEHTIRAVGAVTKALCALEPGAELGIRGPYGRPWPMDALAGAPVMVVAGGIGLAPLREALRVMLADPARFPDVRLIYGARTPEDLLYAREMLGWMERPGFRLWTTVDRAGPSWRGNVGVVTRLLRKDTVPAGASAIMCGPEVMMRFTIEALGKLGVPDERQWVTMERHMKCATGVCGRCQYGPYFVCKDGPVFRYDEVKMLFGRHGF